MPGCPAVAPGCDQRPPGCDRHYGETGDWIHQSTVPDALDGLRARAKAGDASAVVELARLLIARPWAGTIPRRSQ